MRRTFSIRIVILLLPCAFSAAHLHYSRPQHDFRSRRAYAPSALSLPLGCASWLCVRLVQRTLMEVSRSHPAGEISLGLVGSLWSASAGMSAVMDTLNAEYEVQENRSFIRRNTIAIALTAVSAVVLLAAVATVIAGGSTAQAFSRGVCTRMPEHAGDAAGDPKPGAARRQRH